MKQNVSWENKIIKKYEFCANTKSLKFTDCDANTRILYIIVMKISREMICTRPRIVPIIAYRDWLKKPVRQKKMLLNKINIKWISTIESKDENINRLAPNIKCWENANWNEKRRERNIGANNDDGLGIKKISLVTSLIKSNRIWNIPFLPIKTGPNRLWEYDKNFRSTKTTNNVNKTISKLKYKENSYKL